MRTGEYQHPTRRWENGRWHSLSGDAITPEAPLAIRIESGPNGKRQLTDLAITMRTPGMDDALIKGFLLCEGIIHKLADIDRIEQAEGHTATVFLSETVLFKPEQHARFGYTNSSCGLCGKTELDQLEDTFLYFPAPALPKISPELLMALPASFDKEQNLFGQTGGIHAAGLFDKEGQIIQLMEDVGRHNALDKLLGFGLNTSLFPWRDHIILLSGRISYELVQKAAIAGTPILAAIGAPSSAAIALAESTGMTLVGFLRHDRFNVYTYPDRVG